jgi:hypothetical protein
MEIWAVLSTVIEGGGGNSGGGSQRGGGDRGRTGRGEKEEIAVTPVLLDLLNGFCFLTRNAAEMGGHGIWGGENK